MEIIHVEGDPKLKDSKDKTYSMFIGRWQPWHAGHQWLIDQRLKQDKNVLICIRDINPDDKNPFTAQEVEENITKHLSDLINDGKVKVMIIPNVESVNFGRGVGYDIIEHVPPENIKEISATKIRESLKKEKKL
jgi:nicotinamide mononucleotide adenylyltransferase